MDDKVTAPEPVVQTPTIGKIPETSVDIQHAVERVIPVVEQASQALEAPEVSEQTVQAAEVVQTQSEVLAQQIHRMNEAMQHQIVATEVEVTTGPTNTADVVETESATAERLEQFVAEEVAAPQPQEVTNTARQALDNFIHPSYEDEAQQPAQTITEEAAPTIQEIEDSLRSTAPLVVEDWETTVHKPPSEDTESVWDQSSLVEPTQITVDTDASGSPDGTTTEMQEASEPLTRKISVVDLDAEPVAGVLPEQQEVQQEVVKNLETFVAFVRNIHEFESDVTQEKTAVVHNQIEQINELTARLQEAEIVDTDKHVEKIKEDLKTAFIELFAQAGMQIDENKTRHLVNAWIEQDVLQGDLFKTLESELYKDDGMHEVVQRFLAALHVVHQKLLETHEKMGRFVVAYLHTPELAREFVTN